ncbi:MAG TPA: pseudaminic acid synthase [Planctomycetota bacterium]|nr:pseudaminic acid synthase [Planctomycetota bacterium]
MIEFHDHGRTVRIGSGCDPFIIAEMSGNHNQSLERAIAIVDAAAAAGASALKLQTYTPDTMTLNVRHGSFLVEDKGSLWAGRSLYDLYGEAMTPWEWHAPLFARCRERGLVPFSSPFDFSAVDFLETLDCPIWKIASFELVDLPLIRRCAATGRPLIMSTGMATLSEVADAVDAARAAGATDILLLRCTSAYPSPPEAANIATIPHLRETFRVEAGLSDHTMGVGVAVAAVALGAVAVEKHFTLSRAEGGVDSAFSMEPSELAQLVRECRAARAAVGAPCYGAGAHEAQSLKHRRSLYIVNDLPAGHVLSASDVRSIRPGDGLQPKHLQVALGMRLRRSVVRGTPLAWDLLG